PRMRQERQASKEQQPERRGRTRATCRLSFAGRLNRLVGKGVVAVAGFKNPALKQLTDQQVRYTPPARRPEQRARREKPLAGVHPANLYPSQFVCFPIREYRPDPSPALLTRGSARPHALGLMIDAPGGAQERGEGRTIRAEGVSEPYLTLGQISK